ncbi:hypothetical protein NE237_028633 [Protea cynaroides]|uniref:Uncharacterized protein n=1 Tax=Protea cynaroides TaxID=273540 RepID=A0A9Q0GPQ2_9MAGN|nr:hypothetical protein NE237_028633 [Protea cynaroides]
MLPPRPFEADDAHRLTHGCNPLIRCPMLLPRPFEADDAHRLTHGCNPLIRCPMLPPRPFGAEIKGTAPWIRFMESAKILELQDTVTGIADTTFEKTSPNVTYRGYGNESSSRQEGQLPSSITADSMPQHSSIFIAEHQNQSTSTGRDSDNCMGRSNSSIMAMPQSETRTALDDTFPCKAINLLVQ